MTSSREPAGLAAVVQEIFFEISKLALAGRVVHERDEFGGMLGKKGFENVDHVRGRHLATQMRQVIGAQQPRFGGPRDGGRERERAVAEFVAPFRFVPADAKGIEHGRDAGRRDLRVIGEHRAAGVPQHRRARQEMGFEVVRVQFDQARREIVAVEVEALARRVAFAHLGDAPVLDAHAARKDTGRGDDPGVADDERMGVEKFHFGL